VSSGREGTRMYGNELRDGVVVGETDTALVAVL
jgi:hypothetical protein